MLDYGFYNMDCMEGMRQYPDDFFDLAIVDPPYGGGFADNGGCKGWFSKYHQESGGGTTIGSAGGSTSTNTPRRVAWKAQVPRRNQKNHIVGCSPRGRLLRRAFPHLTKPNYMGGKLL